MRDITAEIRPFVAIIISQTRKQNPNQAERRAAARVVTTHQMHVQVPGDVAAHTFCCIAFDDWYRDHCPAELKEKTA